MTPPPPKEIKLTNRGDVLDALTNPGYFVVDLAHLGDLRGTRSTLFNALPDIAARMNDQSESIVIESKADGVHANLINHRLFSQTIQGYTRTATVELEKKVREMVLEHCNLPKESTGYICRMMKNGAEVSWGCSDNTNRIEFLAVLDLNEAHSLEMKYDGNWFPIDVKPSTFLVMAGKPLKGWREGKIHPPELRMNMHGNEKRYSVGLFSYYDNKGKNDEGRIDKGKIDKGKNDEGRINDKGKIDKGKNDEGRINDKGKIDKGKIDKGRIDKVKTEAPKEQVERSRRS